MRYSANCYRFSSHEWQDVPKNLDLEFDAQHLAEVQSFYETVYHMKGTLSYCDSNLLDLQTSEKYITKCSTIVQIHSHGLKDHDAT